MTPLVSILVPVFRGAPFLPALIESVLAQTYGRWELLLVDDASPDESAAVAARYADPRIRYLRHDVNRGADAARQTALAQASGELIAMLDQDDYYLPDKLARHVALFAREPHVGVGYNGRFELNYSSPTVHSLWQPPRAMTLADLVLGFPIAPSDAVIRRAWIERRDVWDDGFWQTGEEIIVNGGEIVFFGRMFLAGCGFGAIDVPLNCRRHHPQRRLTDLAARCQSEIECQRMILDDPRCPEPVKTLRARAYTNTYLVWTQYAMAQGDTALAHELVRHAIHLSPDIVRGEPCPLIRTFLQRSLVDDEADHVADLAHKLAQLPAELAGAARQREWASAQGFLYKGIQALLWGREAQGEASLAEAVRRGADVDDVLAGELTSDLFNHERAFGPQASQSAIARLAPWLDRLQGRTRARQVIGRHHLNRAFAAHASGPRAAVRGEVVRALTHDWRVVTNRGVWSIFMRSFLDRGEPTHA